MGGVQVVEAFVGLYLRVGDDLGEAAALAFEFLVAGVPKPR